jgi:Mce-associated membrane protein
MAPTPEAHRPSPISEGARREVERRGGLTLLRSNGLFAGVAVVMGVVIALLTVTQLSLNSDNSLDNARTSALGAAESYAVDLASYDYRHLDQNFGKVLAESTPSFKKSFTQSSVGLQSALKRYDATASAKVVAAGLLSATASRAVAVVFLDQTDESTTQKNKPTTESRMEITLVRSGSRWLINQVSLL